MDNVLGQNPIRVEQDKLVKQDTPGTLRITRSENGVVTFIEKFSAICRVPSLFTPVKFAEPSFGMDKNLVRLIILWNLYLNVPFAHAPGYSTFFLQLLLKKLKVSDKMPSSFQLSTERRRINWAKIWPSLHCSTCSHFFRKRESSNSYIHIG